MKRLPLNNPEFERQYKEVVIFIELRGYSRGKDCCYPNYIREFLHFIENRGITEIRNVVAVDVIQYYEHLCKRPNQRRGGFLSTSSINSHLFSVRLFFDYLIKVGELPALPCYLPKFYLAKPAPRQILTEDEMKEVIKTCINDSEKALIALAYGCGIRRSELEQLETNDVLLSKGAVIIRHGKGGKCRTIPLTDRGIRTLRKYMGKKPNEFSPEFIFKNSSPFFVNQIGGRMKGRELGKMLQRILKRTKSPEIDDKNITLHCLRHSIATHLQDHGADVQFVKEFLGHTLIDTTTIYSRRRKLRQNLFT